MSWAQASSVLLIWGLIVPWNPKTHFKVQIVLGTSLCGMQELVKNRVLSSYRCVSFFSRLLFYSCSFCSLSPFLNSPSRPSPDRTKASSKTKGPIWILNCIIVWLYKNLCSRPFLFLSNSFKVSQIHLFIWYFFLVTLHSQQSLFVNMYM